MTEAAFFFVYVVSHPEHHERVYSFHSTLEAAELELENSASRGYPAAEDCEVRRVRVRGTPELVGPTGRPEPA